MYRYKQNIELHQGFFRQVYGEERELSSSARSNYNEELMETNPGVGLINSENEGGAEISSLDVLVASKIFRDRVPVRVDCT